MRSFSKLFSVAVIAILATALFFSGCKKDDGDKKELVVSTTGLTQGYVGLIDQDSTGYKHLVVLTSQGFSLNSLAAGGVDGGTAMVGDIMAFVVKTDSQNFSGGSVNYASDLASLVDNFKEAAVYVKGLNITDKSAEKVYVGKTGTLSVVAAGGGFQVSSSLFMGIPYNIVDHTPGLPVLINVAFNGPLTLYTNMNGLMNSLITLLYPAS